jgi:hypothetical protein
MSQNDKYLKPVYGWAMNFAGTKYEKQKNIQFRSACRTQNQEPIPPVFQTDGRYVDNAPFYLLGPQPSPANCPFYNYTLPDTYPEVNSPMMNPKAYWYLPYSTFDWQDYNQNPVVQIQKPGN